MIYMENDLKEIPKFTKLGFEKRKIPSSLYSIIMNEYNSIKTWKIKNDVEYDPTLRKRVVSGISMINNQDNPYYKYYQLSRQTVDECYSTLTPILSEWAGVELERTYQYGIRSYCKNSILDMHTDIQDSHVVSCIVFVAEHPSNTNWPLDFVGHDKKHYQVVFEPGEMLFYESLRPHGRVTPFPGNYYRNFYLHWKPVWWNHPYKYSQRCEFNSVEDAIKNSNYEFK